MKKVGEHITLDFLGTKQDYSPKFYGKIIYKIAKAAKVEILNVSQYKYETIIRKIIYKTLCRLHALLLCLFLNHTQGIFIISLKHNINIIKRVMD